MLFVLAAGTHADSDLWGHLRFGLDTLGTHSLSIVDPYSFTQDRPWVNHEWLSELQMGAAYTWAGASGLAILKGLLAFGTLTLVWLALQGVALPARIAVVAFVALSTAPLTRTLRPQLWSMLCLAYLCRILVEDRRRARWWLPVLFMVWANVHGGWIVGLGVLGVWAVMDVFRVPEGWFDWCVVLLGCTLATLATPYGLGLWRFLYSTVGLSRNITEWQPLWTATAPNWIPWVLSVSGTLWIVVSPIRLQGRAIAVSFMLAYASARVMRLEPLYVEAFAILFAPWLQQRWPDRLDRSQLGKSASDRVGSVVILATCCALAAWLGSTTLRCVAVEGDWTPDVMAASALDGHQPGRLVVFFDWGEYALWHWGPGLRVSMDGRRETIYSDARLADHQAILSGTADGLAMLNKWRADYVWLPASSATTRDWLASHGYRIEVSTAKSFVAVRSDLPILPKGTAAPRPCFPG